MRGVTFGQPLVFETAIGRVEPDAELHYALLLQAAVADPELGVSRDDVALLIWPGVALEVSRHNLRQAMYRLRQLGFPIHLQSGHVTITDLDTEIDVRDLLRGVLCGPDLLSVCTQPFLQGYFPRIGTDFSHWLDELRQRVDRVRRSALVEAVRAARSAAHYREVDKLARALLRLDPLNETGTLALAEAMVMDGSKVEALRLLEQYEAEVGRVSEALRIPARTLRRRVSESFESSLLPRQFEIPFVGRDHEFKVVRDVALRVRGGSGQVVVITGEGGIGKTRLAQEALRLAALDGARVIQYGCTSGDALTPLSSLLSLTQALLHAPGALGCGVEHVQYLRHIVSPEPDSALASRMSAEVAYAQLVYSLSELASAIAHESDLVLFVDDAHRLHETSWRIFTDVIARLPQGRVLLVLAARQLPEWYASLGINGSEGRSTVVGLEAFAPEATRSFVSAWLEKNAVVTSDAACSRVADVSGGNPFYLGELLAHLGRGGALEETPETIRSLVSRQFTALSKGAQRALVAIALFQAHSRLARVRWVLQVPAPEFALALEELEAAGLVESEGSKVRLRHDLIAEEILRSAARSVRQFLRVRVAQRLERDGRRMRSPSLLNDAMMHWERAQHPRRSWQVGLELGEALIGRALFTDAVQVFGRINKASSSRRLQLQAEIGRQRALAGANDWRALYTSTPVESLPGGNTIEAATRLTLHLARIEAGLFCGVPQDWSPLGTTARDLTLPPVLRLRAALLAHISVDNESAPRSCLVQIEDVVPALLRVLGDSNDEALLLRMIACLVSDDAEQAHGLLHRYIALIETQSAPRRVRGMRHATHAALRCRDFVLARMLAQRCLSLCDRLRLPLHSATAYELLSRAHMQLGAWAAGHDAAVRGLDLYGEFAEPRPPVSIHTQAALAAFTLRDPDLAMRLLSSCDLSQPSDWSHGVRIGLAFHDRTLFDPLLASFCLTRSFDHYRKGGLETWVAAAASGLFEFAGFETAATYLSQYVTSIRPSNSTPTPSWSLLPEALRGIVV